MSDDNLGSSKLLLTKSNGNGFNNETVNRTQISKQHFLKFV